MNISVIVPVHNGGEDFKKCLQGLADAEPAPFEIIVVADGPSDGAWKQAEQYGARCILNEESQGPAHARNRGAEIARGKILFFVDADVIIHPEALEEIETAFAEQPELTAVIGSYDDEPGDPNFLSQYRNLLHHYVHQTSDQEASTFWGACGAIRRKAFLEIGGFNEDYARPSIEDIELGYRLKEAGHRIQLRKTLLVKHLKCWSATSILWTDFFCRALPWTKLLLQKRNLDNDLNLQHSNRLSVVLAYLLLGAGVGAFWWTSLGLVAGLSAILLLALNAPLYHFFSCKRGYLFTLKAIPWHWLYYLYCGLAFGVGITLYLTAQAPSRQTGYTLPSRV